MKCPNCTATENRKSGKIRDKQRYECKKCGCHFTQSYKGFVPPVLKLLACVLYMNGLGFRRIAALLNVSHQSVQQWIKRYASQMQKQFPIDKKARHVRVIQLDEMWHYVGKKNGHWH
ncbi:IS1 family transposase [Candidatus Peribacteria bacterium]|nr:IS1 family transposase [Candidatus Peribacteria bacterium]